MTTIRGKKGTLLLATYRSGRYPRSVEWRISVAKEFDVFVTGGTGVAIESARLRAGPPSVEYLTERQR